MNQPKAYIYSINPLDSANGKWDYGLLKEIFERNNIEQLVVDKIPKANKGFVVIPGQGNAKLENEISKQLSNLDRVVLFITGDESARFNVDAITHPNIEIWVQYPHKKHKKYNKFFVGAPQHLKELMPDYPKKDYDIFFSGQVTHTRREQLSKVMPTLDNAFYQPTAGFAQGFTPKEYYGHMSKAKVVPAPAGAVVIDTFRFFEAIEMLCLPVGDKRNSSGIKDEFFTFVYDKNIPIEVVDDWNELKKLLPRLISDYPNNMHQVVCWWLKYKRDLSIKIMRQINE